MYIYKIFYIYINACPVGWGYRIHRLHLSRRVRIPPTSVLDMTLNNLRVRLQYAIKPKQAIYISMHFYIHIKTLTHMCKYMNKYLLCITKLLCEISEMNFSLFNERLFEYFGHRTIND